MSSSHTISPNFQLKGFFWYSIFSFDIFLYFFLLFSSFPPEIPKGLAFSYLPTFLKFSIFNFLLLFQYQFLYVSFTTESLFLLFCFHFSFQWFGLFKFLSGFLFPKNFLFSTFPNYRSGKFQPRNRSIY